MTGPKLGFYDEFGKGIDVHEWGKLKAMPDVWQMADHTDDGYVSTVYLGVSSAEPPLIFETMVWGGPLDREMWRWPSILEATLGHGQVLKWITGQEHA